MTLTRLTDGWPRQYVYFAMATLAIFSIPTATLPWFLCKPLVKSFVSILPGTCMDKGPSVNYARFQASKISILNPCTTEVLTNPVWAALMDISLALIPWKVLWGLQMRTAEKIGVCLAMSLGLLCVYLARLHLGADRNVELGSRQLFVPDTLSFSRPKTHLVSLPCLALHR